MASVNCSLAALTTGEAILGFAAARLRDLRHGTPGLRYVPHPLHNGLIVRFHGFTELLPEEVILRPVGLGLQGGPLG